MLGVLFRKNLFFNVLYDYKPYHTTLSTYWQELKTLKKPAFAKASAGRQGFICLPFSCL